MNIHNAISTQHCHSVMALFVCLLSLTACVNSSTKAIQLPTTPQLSQTLSLSPIPVDTPSITSTEEKASTLSPTLQSSPTAQLFTRKMNCGTAHENGTILFFNQNTAGDRHRPSVYDLFAMNGNGCFPRLILEQASGSPAWSRDWKRIAIGCENNAAICILDTKASLDTCSTVTNPYEEGKCQPEILQKFTLPEEISGDQPMSNLSWSPDSAQIAVIGEKSVHILTLAGDGEWATLIDNHQNADADWSPNENILARSGVVLVDINDQSEITLTEGIRPQWSPDGAEIAFLKALTDENRLYWGIATVNPENNEWHWLYQLNHLNMQDWPRKNLSIDDNVNHRLLSWSPDKRYIAFTVIYRHDYDSQIFRLDIETGEIAALTLDLSLTAGDYYFFAPAWGP